MKLTEAQNSWVQLDVDRLLFVSRGRSAILVDRANELLGPNGGTILVKLTPAGRSAPQREGE